MKYIIPLVCVALALGLGVGSTSAEELRFGPWAYYAPYYFPAFVYDQCVMPADAWQPKYETPPPPAPKGDPTAELLKPSPKQKRILSKMGSIKPVDPFAPDSKMKPMH